MACGLATETIAILKTDLLLLYPSLREKKVFAGISMPECRTVILLSGNQAVESHNKEQP